MTHDKATEESKMKQIILIIKAIQNLGGVASYAQIYEEYGKLTGALMTPGREAMIRKTIKVNSADSDHFSGQNIFYSPQKGSDIWGLTKTTTKYVSLPQVNAVKKETILNLPKRAKTPTEKLYKKIYRRFDAVKYIGDIPIDDEEYSILIAYIRTKFSEMLNAEFAQKDDPICAVALVQIGIREYDGGYWPHVSEVVGLKLDGNKQSKIGSRFYNTLIAHNKIHVEEGEFVNNILMHCFITKHYASDFFDFLFAYYQYDLDRNLDSHKEMKNYLLACMKKAEDSPRAFRIKKGTADAATANEIGCKIRVYNILKWIDAYLFEDRLPQSTSNRTAQFFVEWAKSSKRFMREKSYFYSRGKKRFQYPNLHFDIKSEEFTVVLPVQTVPLNDNEKSAELLWRVSYDSTEIQIQSDSENTVIGCKNAETERVDIKPESVFSGFKIDLIKNQTEIIKRFLINSDCVRFFDSDYDSVSAVRLPEGNVFAFTRRNEALESDSKFEKEPYLGLDFYLLQLQKGNIIKKPDGKAYSVGRDFQEGVLEHNLVEGAFTLKDEEKFPIYSKAPSLLVKMKSSAQVGTLLIINGKKSRLNEQGVMEFKQDNSENNYYLIDLGCYCCDDGCYSVNIDIPSDRKERLFKFSIINGFGYEFTQAPYIYKEKGCVVFSNDLNVSSNGEVASRFDFEINGDTDILLFNVNSFLVGLNVPVFKWKFNIDDEWQIERPKEIWHKELPEKIYFIIPSDSGYIYSEQEIIDEEKKQRVAFVYNNELECFICDTRKILTWLEWGTSVNNLFVHFEGNNFKFLTVVTQCILFSCNLLNNAAEKRLVLQSRIIGFSDCVVDIYHEGNLIGDKIPLTSNGANIVTNKLYGGFEVVFFEYDDDDEFDFGEAVYSEFARKKFSLKNSASLIGKKIEVLYICEDPDPQSIFSPIKYFIKDRLRITVNKADDENENIYYGISDCINFRLSKLKIQIEQIDLKHPEKVLLFFFDEEEGCFVDFVYDKQLKTILTSEDFSLSSSDSKIRYLTYSPNNYYFINISK